MNVDIIISVVIGIAIYDFIKTLLKYVSASKIYWIQRNS